MIEVQALVSSAVYGTPQRSATGFNSKRLNMILAILEKRAGIQIGSKDVFLNITGGINIDDPSIDLAVISSIISSHENIPIDRNICFSGEIGLSGELRGISKPKERLSEAEKLGFNFIDADYDKDNWFARVKGLENEPERGKRCTECFDMRFERSALFANEHGFKVYATTLGISRWKNLEQINESGKRAAKRYANVHYWDFNWRKKGGSSRMIEISKREEFYQQEYCGCVYSLRDTNKWRQKNNKDRIIRGVKFYN